MPPSLPPWMQSPRGLVAAGLLLGLLTAAAPGLVSTMRGAPVDEPAPVRVAPGDDAHGEEPAFAEPETDDWLAAAPLEDDEPFGDDPVDAGEALECLVQPSQIVEIGSQTVGLIEAIHVERGASVEAGQVLVELEAGVERAAVEVARLRASLESAERSREAALALSAKRRKRASNLFEVNALSEDSREELETEARLAELELLEVREARQLAALELRQAEAVLARRSLRAPISGVVTERLLQAGEIVDEETILKVAQVDPLRVDVLLPASRFGRVRPGMRATIEPEHPVEASVVATVAVVDPVIDAASGTFSVRLDLPNPDHLIPGGLHCTVKFLED